MKPSGPYTDLKSGKSDTSIPTSIWIDAVSSRTRISVRRGMTWSRVVWGDS